MSSWIHRIRYALSRSTIFGVRNLLNCFATHIHIHHFHRNKFIVVSVLYTNTLQPVTALQSLRIYILGDGDCWCDAADRQTQCLDSGGKNIEGRHRPKNGKVCAFAAFVHSVAEFRYTLSIPRTPSNGIKYDCLLRCRRTKTSLCLRLHVCGWCECNRRSALNCFFGKTFFSFSLCAKSNKIFNSNGTPSSALSALYSICTDCVFQRNSLTVPSIWKIGDLFVAIIVHVLLAQLQTRLVCGRLRGNAAMRREKEKREKLIFGLLNWREQKVISLSSLLSIFVSIELEIRLAFRCPDDSSRTTEWAN